MPARFGIIGEGKLCRLWKAFPHQAHDPDGEAA